MHVCERETQTETQTERDREREFYLCVWLKTKMYVLTKYNKRAGSLKDGEGLLRCPTVNLPFSSGQRKTQHLIAKMSVNSNAGQAKKDEGKR